MVTWALVGRSCGEEALRQKPSECVRSPVCVGLCVHVHASAKDDIIGLW